MQNTAYDSFVWCEVWLEISTSQRHKGAFVAHRITRDTRICIHSAVVQPASLLSYSRLGHITSGDGALCPVCNPTKCVNALRESLKCSIITRNKYTKPHFTTSFDRLWPKSTPKDFLTLFSNSLLFHCEILQIC